MTSMKLKGMQGLVGAVVIALSCTGAQAAGVWLPRTRVHIQCTFPDGSYTEYKVREKWAFYAELIPHAQSYTPLDAELGYVDTQGRRHDGVGATNLDCGRVGKRAGRMFWAGGFESLDHRMVEFGWAPLKPGEIALENMPVPDRLPQLQAVLEQLKTNEFVFAKDKALVIAQGAQQLLLEQALSTSGHANQPLNTVLYVLQSRSSDFGKTWSEPVLTKKAELYEIGRTLDAQSWAPQRNVIVQDRSLRR
ncbi:MAG TPA: hypothetical protein VFS95_07640 [Telluria sp.]|nr:hypothetical protein [Telluria sp.]